MNRFLISTWFLGAIFVAHAQDVFDIYYPNAGWLIPAFMATDTTQCHIDMPDVVLLMRERPWYYFCNNETDFSWSHYLDRYLIQCRAYDRFLYVCAPPPDFYAFYFSLLSKNIKRLVVQADAVDDVVDRDRLLDRAHEQVYECSCLVDHLRGSSWYERARRQLKRWESLLQMMEDEV